MWKKLFRPTNVRHKILEGKECCDDSKSSKTHPSYTTLPPFSYDWIYRGSSTLSSYPGGAMPPLVHPQDSPGGRLVMAGEEREVKTKLKCVLVGDGAVGKTSLVVSYTTNGYPTEYVPTAFDNYNVVVNVDNQPIRLQLCDTAGQDDFDTLRPLCYPGTDVFLVCFSVVSPTSFHNVRDKWLPELRHHNPSVPILLVGTQSDLRTDVKVLIELAQFREQPVSESSAWKLVHQMEAVGYVESSALTQKNLKEVFDQAIVSALEVRTSSFKRNSSSRRRSSNKRRATIDLFSSTRDDNVIDYDEEERRKGGWRKLCCFS
ncbi:UNVERIFIED_CONTAM: hypothetical protein RMT77_011897 [Armadillidium vulgare]